MQLLYGIIFAMLVLCVGLVLKFYQPVHFLLILVCPSLANIYLILTILYL